MMLYEEESKGLNGREDIYTMARALSRDLSRARRCAQRDCPSTPYQQILWSELTEPNLLRKEHVIEGRALEFHRISLSLRSYLNILYKIIR
jgi:hypothetical protein